MCRLFTRMVELIPASFLAFDALVNLFTFLITHSKILLSVHKYRTDVHSVSRIFIEFINFRSLQ